MCKELVDLVMHWNLSPIAVAGWLIAAALAAAVAAMWRLQQARVRDIQDWLREDSEAKVQAARAYAKVATSLATLEQAMATQEKLAALRDSFRQRS